jgi:TrmH family RNA methyltransferase
MTLAMKSITSAANPAYRDWLRLATQPRQVRLQRRTLAEGAHLAQAWLDTDLPIESVLVSAAEGGAERDPIVQKLSTRAPVHRLSAALFNALGLVEHGIGLALVVPIVEPLVGPLAGDAVYLDGVQDPGNVGALLRVAAGAGVRHVLASPSTASLWSARALRAGQGAHLQLDLREGIEPSCLAQLPLHWIGTALSARADVWDLPLPADKPVGWVVGAEGKGVSAQALAACADTTRIPLAPGVESLNVATAAAVCLFERQRRLRAGRQVPPDRAR